MQCSKVWVAILVLVSYRPRREAHSKDRTLAGFACHRHVAAHHARELAGDGKAKAGALD
jgi:hypothetical protein